MSPNHTPVPYGHMYTLCYLITALWVLTLLIFYLLQNQHLPVNLVSLNNGSKSWIDEPEPDVVFKGHLRKKEKATPS